MSGMTLFCMRYTCRTNPRNWDLKENLPLKSKKRLDELEWVDNVLVGISESGIHILKESTKEVLGVHALGHIVNHRCRPNLDMWYFVVGRFEEPEDQKVCCHQIQ